VSLIFLNIAFFVSFNFLFFSFYLMWDYFSSDCCLILIWLSFVLISKLNVLSCPCIFMQPCLWEATLCIVSCLSVHLVSARYPRAKSYRSTLCFSTSVALPMALYKYVYPPFAGTTAGTQPKCGNGGVSDAVTSELGDRQSSHPVKNPASVFWQVFRGVARCCLPRFQGQRQHLKYQNQIKKN